MAIRRVMFCAAVIAIAFSNTYAAGVEVAVGGWRQAIGGNLSYSETSIPGVIDLDNDIAFDDENRLFGRLKIDMPGFFPNLYLVAAPMDFEGTGTKSGTLNFGDITFDFSAGLNSKITLNQYDAAFYYGLPFIKTGTMGKLNVDLGLNVRVVDFEISVSGTSGGSAATESQSLVLALPMLYVSAQLMPLNSLGIEVEGRGIAVGGNKLYSLLGRVRYNFAGPVFVAAGYRLDKLEIDEVDVIADTEFQGPFFEMGIKF